jgi:hypothetical protein
MHFCRAFVKPSKVDLGVNDVVFRFSNIAADANPKPFIESVSVASGPIDFPLSYDGFPNIFVKRARLFLPGVYGSFIMTTFNLATASIDIAQYAMVRGLESFPDNPLRIRADANHPFRCNEWIDCNSFLKSDPANQASDPHMQIAINAVEVGVTFDAPAATKNLAGARIEIEYHCNMETHR